MLGVRNKRDKKRLKSKLGIVLKDENGTPSVNSLTRAEVTKLLALLS